MQYQPNFKNVESVLNSTGLGTVVYAVKPGDGSAREQAASCQRVLGGCANIAIEYATKRYRSNLINWGMLPFTVQGDSNISFEVDDYIFIPSIRQSILDMEDIIQAQVFSTEGIKEIELKLNPLTQDEREIILEGCLINYYAAK
jgi:aconitate hydratase